MSEELVKVGPKTGAIEFANRGVHPQNIEDLYRYAVIVHESRLAPAGLDSPQKIVIAAETGVELGFPIQAAIRSIFVVNGVPALKGDAAKALVLSSGLMTSFAEEVKGEGDDRHAVVQVIRRGMSALHERTFSIADAKAAGLLPGHARSGWAKYPDRMLKYRALGFILRDVFPDVLLGVHIAEEMPWIDEVQRTAPTRKEAPSNPDNLLAGIVQAERSPDPADAGTSEKIVDPGAAESVASDVQGDDPDPIADADGVEIAHDPRSGSSVADGPAFLAIVNENVACGLCGHEQEYEVNCADVTVKDVAVKCGKCGAEFPFANPNFAQTDLPF